MAEHVQRSRAPHAARADIGGWPGRRDMKEGVVGLLAMARGCCVFLPSAGGNDATARWGLRVKPYKWEPNGGFGAH
jgi:hypothetical protein